MATRLLGIVVVPMLVLLATAGLNVRQLRGRSDDANAISRTMEAVEAEVSTDLVVSRFVYLHGAKAVGATFGLTSTETGEVLDLDLEGELEAVAAEFSALVRRLGPGSDVDARIRDTMRLVDDLERSDGSDAIQVLAGLIGETDRRASDRLIASDRSLRETDGVGRIRSTHAAVRSALDAMEALGGQLSWIGVLSTASAAEEWSTMLAEYRGFTAAYEHASGELARIAAERSETAWLEIDESRATTANAEWFSEMAVQSAPTLPANELELARILGKGVQRMIDFSRIAVVGLQEAEKEAQRISGGADRTLWLTYVAITGLIALTLALVLLIARSINRPIRALSAAAERVSTGDLDDVELPAGGPPELRRVSRTLAEVVANLRTVEAQVGTLAAGDLDARELDAPVPGRLGDFLHASVGRLSRAMSEREELATKLEHEATHDGLTGLPNRAAARDALSAALERGRRAGTSVAVLFLDLDSFKQVNDTHGHDIGDEVLRVTAARLSAAVRAGDLVARIGGDEFVVVAEPAGDGFTMLELGNRLVEEVSAPITAGSIATRVGASVGVALALDGELDPDVLFRDADLAAYRAKSSGRGRAELFDDQLRAEVGRRLEVEHGLRSAIADDELELFFQPVVNPAGVASGVEALVRWHRPGVGTVSPDDFIPVAEGSDLIIDLGRWVLQNACAHLARWTDDPVLGSFTMGVNLSGRHLLSLTVVDDIRAAIDATGADPTRLIVEITETVLMADLPLVTEHLERIRDLGVRVAIDDFGTGYTSLTHLRRLPVDIVKVDRSMVSADQPNDALVLKLLIDTVHSLGLRLVAEGVETIEQLARVETLGCDEIQGFLFSRPVPIPGLLEAVRGSTRA